MTTFYKQENPTSSDNVSAGYALNDIWVNIITYDGYEQISDGNWKWVENKWGSYIPNQGYLTLNEETETVVVTDNQTIDGVKTFLKSPIVPTPTGDTATANKKYVDDKVSVIPMAMVFDTVEDLDAWLAITGNTSILNNGVTFYIKDLDVPDYWWNADDQQKEPLESPKLDLIPKTQNELLKEPTGFKDPGLVVITGADLKVTLSGSVEAHWRGEVVAELISGYLSPAHGTDTSKVYFLSYNGTDVLWSDQIWTFDQLQIAVAKYDASNSRWHYLRECHGLMAWETHQEFHNTIGTYKGSGGGFDDFTLSSIIAANRRPDIEQTVINDEDLPSTLPALISKQYTQLYLNGADNLMYEINAADIVRLSVNNPYYNLFTGGEWGGQLMPNNSVGSVWVYAVPATADAISQDYRFLFVQPQWITLAGGAAAAQITNAVNAELERLPSELNLGNLLDNEIIAIGRIVIAYTGSNWTLRSVSELTGNKYSQIGSPSGAFLSIVTTDYTLTGTGTLSDPLKIQGVRTVDLPAYEIDLELGEDFTKTCDTGSTFTIINPIIKKSFRLFLTGGTIAAPLFTGYTSTWVASTAIGDYNPLVVNVLVCEIRSAGEITLFWGA